MGSMAEQEVKKPWEETPLIESAALSKAAGWYENMKALHTRVKAEQCEAKYF